LYSLSSWRLALTDSWAEVWSAFLRVLPEILGAIVIFIIGIIVAYWIKRIIVGFLKLIKFEKITEPAGVERYLKKADIKLSFNELLGATFQWLVVLIFFLAAVDILGLSAVSQMLFGILGYVPNIIAAVLIFAAGYIVANVVNGLVRGSLVSIDHEVAKPLGRLARWLVLIIAFFAAIDQLQIAQGLVSVFYQGLTYTVVLAIGLSVGLGAKDLVSKILNDWYERIKR